MHRGKKDGVQVPSSPMGRPTLSSATQRRKPSLGSVAAEMVPSLKLGAQPSPSVASPPSSSAPKTKVVKLAAAVPGTPLFGFGRVKVKKLADLVGELIDRRLTPKTRARRWWDLLRIHVKQGFFQSFVKSNDDSASDFLSLVDRMWTLVHKYSPDDQSRMHKDSTTEFVLAGWAKIKAAQHAVARQGARKSTENLAADAFKSSRRQESAITRLESGGDLEYSAGMAQYGRGGRFADRNDMSTNRSSLLFGDGNLQNSESQESINQFEDLERNGNNGFERAGTQGRGSLGIEGLSFDTVPNVHVGQILKRIAIGLSVQPLDEADFYTVQVHFNRGWKLLLLGLTQAESFARYMAMCALRRAIPIINDTLLDSTTRENLILVLVNLMLSDERTENRLKAVYLLGQFGYYLGAVTEHEHLLLIAFKELAKRLLEIQFEEKNGLENPQRFSSETRALKIYLIHAIGKFTRYVHQRSRFIEDLVVYMLHEEFAVGDTKILPTKAKSGDKNQSSYVVRALLGVLDNEMKRTDFNEKYIGAIFKQFVHPLMRSSNQAMQMMAVQFISNWMPITNEDATMIGLETLEAGLKATKDLGVRNFSKDRYDHELNAIRKRRVAEESRMAIRSKLLRQLLQMPGTYAKLRPALDHPGFFIDTDSSMMNTTGIVVSLPIHPKSSVTLTRPLPPIPGVPLAVTTIPPVFMEPSWAEKLPPPKFRYEYQERTGAIPGLPFGYTYCPTTFVDVYAMKGIDPKNRLDSQQSITNGPGRNLSFTQGAQNHRSSVKASNLKMQRLKNPVNSSQTRLVPALTEASESEDSIMPLTGGRINSINPAQAKLLVAAAGEARRSMQKKELPLPRNSSFGFVKRASLSDSFSRRPTGDSSWKPTSEDAESKIGPIPTGMLRAPPKEEIKLEVIRSGSMSNRDPSGDVKKIAPGFMTVCPFPGYDPDRFDRTVTIISAIYSKARTNGRGSKSISSEGSETVGDGNSARLHGRPDFIPLGYTPDRNPVLWPHKNLNLNSVSQFSDFPVFAPVLFDIIQPGTTHLQRVLCQVISINKDVSAISVQKGANGDNLLSVGATFNIFIRTRASPEEWNCINLEVMDDDYQDNYVFGSLRPKSNGPNSSISSSIGSLINATKQSSTRADLSQSGSSPLRPVGQATAIGVGTTGGNNLPSNFPLPAGFTSNGEPYFAPPVNLPPIPAGYTPENIPYFGKTPTIKPQPVGMTTDGIRYYSPDGRLGEGTRCQLAGFDLNGQPFFIPRGCSLPPPVGFTTDGIAYYDIPSLMHHRGIMILPTSKNDRVNWPLFEDEDDGMLFGDSESFEGDEEGHKGTKDQRIEHGRKQRIDYTGLTNDLIATLEATQPELKQSFLKGRPRKLGTVHRIRECMPRVTDQDSPLEVDEDIIADPTDTVSFLKGSDDFAYLKPTNMRVAIEPSVLDFQSVHAPVTKIAVLRYRAGRGDHEERDFFISVLPVDIFTVQSFHLRLQGEGVSQISLTYFPRAMQADRIEGSMSLIDDTGKKLASCTLIALRQSFVKISPSSIDAGWILPEKRKEIFMRTENVSGIAVSLTFDLQSEIEEQTASATAAAMLAGKDVSSSVEEEVIKASSFVLSTKSLRLQPGESKQISIFFEPANLGRFTDVIVVNAPGGDLIKVNVHGIAGMPIALYPEASADSMAGGEALTRERCEFMKKFKRQEAESVRTHVPLSEQDVYIIQNMMSATADAESRKEAHTLDFGICSADRQSIMRCLTIMNLSDNSITVGLYPHNPAITCPYLVRVSPRMAHSVEITLNISDNLKGNIRMAIEVICPEFQNIPLYVVAFVGQPLFFPSWEYAFFKPCMIGKSEQLCMTLVNESHYDISFAITNLFHEKKQDQNLNHFTTSLSTNDFDPTKIRAYSLLNVVFVFNARQRGPLMSRIGFKMTNPVVQDFPAVVSGKPLTLLGICIEPYPHKPGDLPDKNGIEFLRMWMSHPKRLLEEYPNQESDREKRFDLSSSPSRKPRADNLESDIFFFKDSLVFRHPRPEANNEEPQIRRSQILPMTVQHKGSKELPTEFFGSTLFNIDPRLKEMRKGDTVNCDVMFTPPHDAADNVTTYGFGIAIVQEDHSFHAIQLLSRPFSDFVSYPGIGPDGNIVVDFGKQEVSSQALEVNVRTLMLANDYQSAYSWNLKPVSSKNKFSAFDIGMNFGELHPTEGFPVPIKFHSDSSGLFETIAELSVKETLDRLAKSNKVANLVLRGQTVNTSLTGIPDGLDFGSTVVFNKKKKKFIITNNGTTETKVTLLTRLPFAVAPKTFQLAPKISQEITVTFTPTESRSSNNKMLIFANHKLYIVPTCGSGGTAELICEKYDSRDIDFGHQREGTVAWISVYLTNKGTLPLVLKAITAEIPDLIKIEFLKITSTVPYEGNQASNKAQLSIRRDYWGILRRKLKVFTILNSLTRKKTVADSGIKVDRRQRKLEEEGSLVTVFKKGAISIAEQTLVPTIPQLRPFYSYHFRLGYLNKYQPKKDTFVQFHYVPITSDDETYQTPALIKNMSVHVVGNVYRPLEFFPPYHDFGLAPAETWSIADYKRNHKIYDANYGVSSGHMEEGSYFSLHVINMSMEAQNLALQSINSEFSINGRQWQVYPGEKLEIPIEFHPSKEQLQYRGEARFSHNYGTQSIRLSGTGASADLSVDDVLDFGSLKIGSKGTRSFRLCNRGLLDCKYRLEILQVGTDYRLIYDEPFEHEGSVASGAAEILDIECSCQKENETKAHISVKWERIPKGVWEEIIVPITVQVGIPMFQLKSLELDFKTTYIKVNKTLAFEITNSGNAVCYWSAESKSPLVIIDPDSGSIEPGDTISVEATYLPENYDSLSSEIVFTTDAGTKSLMCYGIVGIPYLLIPEDSMIIDFGISAIEKPHSKSVTFSNSGVKPIEFEIIITDMMRDGILAPPDEFEVFFANPTHGIIPPNSSLPITFQAVPKNYNSTVSATFIVRTRDGEQYSGQVKATGGKAIIKIAPPEVVQETGTKTQTAEMKRIKPPPRDRSGTPKASPFEAARLAFQSHIENLQDVLAGLRTAEMEVSGLEQIARTESGSRKRTAKTSEGENGRKGSGQKKENDLFKEYDELIGMLTTARPLHATEDKARKDGDAEQVDTTESGQPDSFKRARSQQRRQDSIGMAAVEASILERAEEEQRKRLASGSLVYDGSDLRTRVKRAVTSSASTRRSRENGTGDGDVVGRRTHSGRVRLTPRQGVADMEEIVKKSPNEKEVLPKHLTNEIQQHFADEMEKQQHLANEIEKQLKSSSDREEGSNTLRSSAAEAALTKGDTEIAEKERPPPRNSASARRRKLALTEDHFAIEHSTAVQYLDQLSSLEAELESLSNSLKAMSNGAETVAQTQSGIGRYNAGTPKRVLRSRDSEGRLLLTRSRGNQSKPTDSSDVTTALERPVEDLVALAQQMVSDTAGASDVNSQGRLIEEMNQKIIDSTRGVIKAVKDQLANQWIVNREFLSSALQKVQQTTHIMEALSFAAPPVERLENDFDLGLVRGGQHVENILLFNLPNMGNLEFDFEIVEVDTVVLRPQEFDPTDASVSLFTITPKSGDIKPSGSVNISASFLGRITGLYQQSYEVMSSGEKFLSFTVSAKVGNSRIAVEPGALDFGLVKRHKTETRTLIISNVGTYKDFWRVEPLVMPPSDEENIFSKGTDSRPAFKLSAMRGELEAGDVAPLHVTFCPTLEGAFDNSFRLIWSGAPQLIKVVGTGGGARIKAIFVDENDIKFGGLDWGICIVGVESRKIFQLTNVGNVEGLVKVSHSNPAFQVLAKLDAHGEVKIAPGGFVNIEIMYCPVQTEVSKEAVQITMADSPVYLVPIRAQAGVCDWQINGELNLKNMPMSDIQVSSISVTNTGGLDIPLECKLEVEENLRHIVKLSLKDSKASDPGPIKLRPRQRLHIDVTVTPKDHARIVGDLILITNMGKGPVTKRYPFDFFSYAEQIALDNQKDVSVGRVMVGESAEVIRTLTNFGSEKVRYRLRLESVSESFEAAQSLASLQTEENSTPAGGQGTNTKKSKSKPNQKSGRSKLLEAGPDHKGSLAPWRIEGQMEGYISPNEVINIGAVFQSDDEDTKEWYDARLVVERCDDEVKEIWTEITALRLTGASGTPKLSIEPEILDFDHHGLAFSKYQSVIFRNEGNAPVDYEVVRPWDFDGNIFIEDECPTAGKIQPDELVELKIRFTPTEVITYETNISVRYQLGVKTFKIIGKGATYQFHKQSLPNVLQFGSMSFGDASELPLVVHNDCRFPISVKWDATSSDPDAGVERQPSDCVSLTPELIEIIANSSDTERMSNRFRVKLSVPVPLNEDGLPDAEAITSMVQRKTIKHFLKLETVNGYGYSAFQVIPITFACHTHRLALIQVSKYREIESVSEFRLLESELVKLVDFGEVTMAVGASAKFVVYNPNNFNVFYEVLCSEKQFAVTPIQCSVISKGFREITIDFKSLDVSDDDETVPASLSFRGEVTFSTNIPAIPGFEVNLEGTLIDRAPALNNYEPIDFGNVRKLLTSQQFVEFRNPARRPLPYKFSVEKNYADIFKAEESSISGIARPRQVIRIPIKFYPKMGGVHNASAFLETPEGNYVIPLRGKGVEPQISLEKERVAFGVVGVGAPEFRNVELSNPSDVPIRVGIKSDNVNFTTDGPEEMIIEPGEKKEIRLIFSPGEMARPHTGFVRFVDLDLRPGQKKHDVLGKLEMEGMGGTYEFSVGGDEDDSESGGVIQSTAPGSRVPTINVNFPKVVVSQKTRKYFEVVNCGDTVVDIAITDNQGREVPSGGIEATADIVTYIITPVVAVIQPKTKQKFGVVLKGLRAGSVSFSLQVRTRTLTEAKAIPINIKANVISPEALLGDSIRAFARAETNFETILDIMAQEENRFSSERNMWKVLLPIERVRPLLPSMELKTVPVMEPTTQLPDIGPYVIRPPAIPRDLPPRAKKWYMNRVSMALDQGTKRGLTTTDKDAGRRSEAIEFGKPVEKQIFLEKKNYRGSR